MNRKIKDLLSESRLQEALQTTRAKLLSLRSPENIWTGELSASSLSTATAVVALLIAQRHASATDPRTMQVIEKGLLWLATHANPDGGWGDTILSKSNISTTTLVWAALGAGPTDSPANRQAVAGAEKWLWHYAGGLEPELLAAKILQRYGKDRTFSAPILTHCALAGRFGDGPEAWRTVIALPFELAAFPSSWFGALYLPVVSYALPALIAIGYARHRHAPSRNPFSRAIRSLVAGRVLRVLESIQPSNGGFLEAIPLTSFVVMSLAASGQSDHPVAKRGLQFLLNSAQPDGSWRIDTNLSTFVTTLAVHALATGEHDPLSKAERASIGYWLLKQQYRSPHPYTNAAPGGWAWTPLPGGVPDADDTPGALLALKLLELPAAEAKEAVALGVTWLMNLQNRDGGIPTFCRGWGNLPFDRSSADLTAHALRAWVSWQPQLPGPLRTKIQASMQRSVDFLKGAQEADGSWFPLWFGSEDEPDECNRVYGTSRVILALAETGEAPECVLKALAWLVRVQKADGGWSGGAAPCPSSTEETALALEALSTALEHAPELRPMLQRSIRLGLANLLDRVESGRWIDPAPIGFYFAKLWYYEKLYPLIFTVAALGRVSRIFRALEVTPDH